MSAFYEAGGGEVCSVALHTALLEVLFSFNAIVELPAITVQANVKGEVSIEELGYRSLHI